MEAELIGALIGDGHISLACGNHCVGFTGHPEDDYEYYLYLSCLIQKVWEKEVFPKERLRGLRMGFGSKLIVGRLINLWELEYGEGKSKRVVIPKKLTKSEWKILKCVIRGIADTDGSVFYSKKPGVEKYPAIELTTISLGLAKQLREILLLNGFRVTKLRNYKSKLSQNLTYKVCLYGQENLKHWLDEIGFSNPVKRVKAITLCRDY